MCDGLKAKIAHLGMIQGVISRMATGSFTIKGYVVALLVALMIAFSRGSLDEGFKLIVYFPFFLIFLDAYYLRQERIYRGMYSLVAKRESVDMDFRMGPDKDEVKSISYLKCWMSVAILPFYGLLVILITIFLFAMKK